MESKDTYLIPEGSEWKIIDELLNVLTPFNLATETLSKEKYPTITMIVPLLHKLLNVSLKICDNDHRRRNRGGQGGHGPQRIYKVHFGPPLFTSHAAI